ncbi:MAG: DUF58 domain-containing protein [Candidatus Rokubacteria bacterium]|nr:DUF58 domain-containing protein [Candidatus Rokubacteria bacterium]
MAWLGRWWQSLRPPRTIRPTREGWWFLCSALGLGFAAVNTGNNLLYLLLSMLLSTIVVSGILSEQTMRRLRLSPVAPREIFAGEPVAVGCLVSNTKRVLPSYSLAVEVPTRERGHPHLFYVPRLDAGQQRLFTWEETFPRRGRHRLPGVRLTTRFPFGLFRKATPPIVFEELLVFPAVRPLAPEDLRGLGGSGGEREPRPGRGTDLYNLREYRWGDDPRLIHWKSTAKSGAVMVRELEAEAALRVRLVLEEPPMNADPGQLEADISWAASLASHLIGQGSRVAVAGAGLSIALGGGPAHLRRIFEALALYDPPHLNPLPHRGRGQGEGATRVQAAIARAGAAAEPRLREIRIALGAGAPGQRSGSASRA